MANIYDFLPPCPHCPDGKLAYWIGDDSYHCVKCMGVVEGEVIAREFNACIARWGAAQDA